jgi:predicted transcriptional regulator
MAKFNLPTRLFCDGDKKMVSMRIPARLMKALDALAKEKGWTTTDIICTALDQFVQWEKRKDVD